LSESRPDTRSEKTLIFRCPPGFEDVAPEPIPAIQGLPDWFKAMPQQAFSATLGADDDTVKRCPPFIDAMAAGFLIPLVCDVRVENGEFSWDQDFPAGVGGNFPRSPVSFHDPAQVTGAPMFDADRFLIKFHNPWTIQAPEGYALLFTHPFNRFDLPFTTLTGMIDCDRYSDMWISFPAIWRDENFSGVLPKGTPIAQCVPVKRDRWSQQTQVMTEAEQARAHALQADIGREPGVYRKRFRV
jgi:hypothetical protein